MASHLFTPLTLAQVTFANRIFVSPMCQYSSTDGFANDWHLVHLGARAQGGASLVITEAAAIVPEGRISPADLGLWKDEHIAGLRRITDFLHSQGSAAGIQLAHAGRKASTRIPWEGDGAVAPEDGGWQTVAPSAIPFSSTYPQPRELTVEEVHAIPQAFANAARRAIEAGFDVVEIHAAHGYLLHQFLSPLSNQRKDEYGGSFENRIRLLLEVVDATRAVWTSERPLFVRISATDWVEGGWNLAESVNLARELRKHGVDLIDTSTGGMVPHAKIPVGPGYQVAFAEQIRQEADIPTGAVGMITEPRQAESILAAGQADAVLLARELLRDPYWPIHAALALDEVPALPRQYLRSAIRNAPERKPF